MQSSSRSLISLKAVPPGAIMDAEEKVRLAVFADIHANRQAFSACLEAARARGAERIVCLGDIVGYGADPEWAVDTVMDLVERGAIAVRGNHDNAIGIPSENMNAVAQAAIEWTRGRLSGPQRRFLAELPLTRQEDDRLYVHSEASQPRAMALRAKHARTPRAASRRPPPMSPSADTSTSPRCIRCRRRRR